MSSENESNDNCDDSQVEGQEENSSARAEVSSQKRTECLISLVEKYRLLYDLEDSSHKDKWKIANAWTEIASGTGETGKFRKRNKLFVVSIFDLEIIHTQNSQIAVPWCKNKWKITRDYYYKLKSANKGKSGQKRGKAITWQFFNMMSFLDGVKNSNENTTSNLDFLGPAKVPRTDDLTSNSSDGQNEHNPDDSPSSTRVENGTSKSSLPVISSPFVFTIVTMIQIMHFVMQIKKRSLNSQDELNMKMIEYLDKSSQALESHPEEPADEISCWGRLAVSRLRQLHPSHATATMMQCDQVIVTAIQGAHSFMQRLETYDNEPNDYNYRQQ